MSINPLAIGQTLSEQALPAFQPESNASKPSIPPVLQPGSLTGPQNATPLILSLPSQGTPLPNLPVPVAKDQFTRVRVLSDVCIHKNLTKMPKMVTAFKEATVDGEQNGLEVLRFNQGDTNVGPNAKEFALAMRLNSLLNLHAGTMGNHEMDASVESFANAIQDANYPFLVSNLTFPTGTLWDSLSQQGKLSTQSKVIDGKQGKYGVIGVTTPTMLNFVDKTLERQGVGTLDEDDTRLAIRREVEALKKQGVNKIILLSHMGLEIEKEIAESVSGIDVILGGHSHDKTLGVTPGDNLLMGPNDEPVLLLQSGKNGKFLDVADLTFDSHGWLVDAHQHLVPTKQFAPDATAQTLIDDTLGPQKVVAHLANGYNNQGNSFRTDPLAELVADTARELTGADIALVRSSQIRRDIEPSPDSLNDIPLTPLDLKEVFPFDGKLIVAKLTGDAIFKSLERSAEALEEGDPHPGMQHPSGLSMVIDKEEGELKEVWVFNRGNEAWESLNPFKTYTVAYSDFIIANKTELPELANPIEIVQQTDIPFRKLLHLGLNLVGADEKPLMLQSDNRIKIV